MKMKGDKVFSRTNKKNFKKSVKVKSLKPKKMKGDKGKPKQRVVEESTQIENGVEGDKMSKNKNSILSQAGKWYDEAKYSGVVTTNSLSYEQVQKLRTEASSIFSEAVILNNSKAPKSLSGSEYAWVKTVLSKGTSTDKVAAYVLLIQDSPLYKLNLLKNMVEMVKVGKKKDCFMAVDTLCELFLNDLLPPNRKLLVFADQPLSKLDEITSNNTASRKRKLLLWYFEDQLKSLYDDFVTYLNKIAHDTVDANKEKAITAMCKLLEGHPEKENVLLNNIVNKLGDPSHKVGSKVIYALTKLLETHPNMREVVVEAVEKVIFRPNISKRAQYYSVCFLSQFCLFNGESKLAKQLILIYLSLFKGCIKMGDVDSRMMSALLTGVNRAYPFGKEDLGMLKEHIDTIYKVIHLSHPNIAIQALSLVYLISDYSNAYIDRFFTVLYKKIGEPEMFKSSHHAMLLSLIFKALRKDKEMNRVCAFIKRLLQISTYVPVPVCCGILIMVSELIKFKKDVLVREVAPDTQATIKLEVGDDDDDDGVEHYEDVKLEEEEGEKKNLNSSALKDDAEESPDVKEITETKANVFNVTPLEEAKVWCNPDKSLEDEKGAGVKNYDPFARNPLYSGAKNTLCCELFKLSRHFHPTISLFANNIINGKSIVYTGDPLLDFTLIRFLDKFSFKNPKEIKSDEEKNLTFSMFGRKKYYSSARVRRLRANTAEYLQCSENRIPVDEVFLYRFMKDKAATGFMSKRGDDSDVESVGSDEFDEMLSGLVDGKKDDIDFMKEVGKLPMKKKKQKGEDEDEDEDEPDLEEMEDDDDEDGGDDDDDDDLGDEADSDLGSLAEDFEGDELDEFGDDDEEMQGSDLDEEELETTFKGLKLPKLPNLKEGKTKQKKGKEKFKDNLFASAEEFSELLEEADYNAGGSEALSNKDRAGLKQLKWETDRDKWIHKKNFRSRGVKRAEMRKKHNKGRKGDKKKRF